MDGTLVDTEKHWIEAEYRLVESFGGTWTEQLSEQLIGSALPASARFILERTPVDLPVEEVIDRLQGHVVRRVTEAVEWRPGARELLAACRALDIPCALVTMSWTELAGPVVAALPEDTFDVVVTGDQVSHGKPHPEPYLTAVSGLGVPAAECVALEDSPTGVRSAVAAGVPTLAVPYLATLPHVDGAVVLPDGLAGLDPHDLLRHLRGSAAEGGAERLEVAPRAQT